MEDINAVEFVESRSLEIQSIEDSIKKSNKKTMLFQRVPFYKRRRNRNYDKKKSKKFTYRKRDRNFLRTHNFYAKRFFMLKLDKTGIPITRHIKSSKFIYKTKDQGFIFDESFRGVSEYLLSDILNYNNKLEKCENNNILNNESELVAYDTISNNKNSILKHYPLGIDEVSIDDLKNLVDFKILNKIQYLNNEFEAIITESSFFIIGKSIKNLNPVNYYCSFSILKNKNVNLQNLIKNFNVNKKEVLHFLSFNNEIESEKILCKRNQVMELWQIFINNKIIPICLNEINRIYLESDKMSVYDNIKSNLFLKIEEKINEDIIKKFERTPKSKKMDFDLKKLFLFSEPCFKYFIFQVIKGNIENCAEIFDDDKIIGRVIRGGYKFTNGKCYGLGFFTCEFNFKNNNIFDEVFFMKNLKQKNFYEIKIVNFL